MLPAVIWLGAGLVLAIAEVVSGEFVLLMLGGGALAAGVASLLGADIALGGVVFVIASVVLLFAVRPALRRRLDRGIVPSIMHTGALVGRPGVAVTRVDRSGGRITIDGDLWSARAYADGEVIDVGAGVTVVEIAGATALVIERD